MAKRTISFGDYEEPTWEEYTGEDPPANKWFNAALTKVAYKEEDDQLMFVFEITEGDFKGWGKGWYAPFEGDLKWKMHQVLKAVQGGKTTDVTVDWENERAVAAWVAKQKPVKIKTRMYNDNISINKIAPLLEAVPTGKASAKKEAELPEDTDAGDDEAIEDYTAEELGEMEVADLEEILEEEFELPKDDEDFPKKSARDRTGAKYKKALVEAILTEQASDEDEDPDNGNVGGEEEEADEEFEDGFDEDTAEEPEPEPAPAPRARRSRTAKPAPAKAAPPAKAAATTTRRRRG